MRLDMHPWKPFATGGVVLAFAGVFAERHPHIHSEPGSTIPVVTTADAYASGGTVGLGVTHTRSGWTGGAAV